MTAAQATLTTPPDPDLQGQASQDGACQETPGQETSGQDAPDQEVPGQDAAALQVIADLTADPDTGFATLYAAYQSAVFSTALRLGGHRQEAEDLTAETFLRAYRALIGYDAARIAELRPRAWLLTILTNLWRNSLRTAARRPRTDPLTTDDATHHPTDPAPGVETTVTHRETGRELAVLLERLPPAQRAAVVLRHVTDLPLAEISAILDLPEGTVKSHISRGLARLRRLHTTTTNDTTGGPA